MNIVTITVFLAFSALASPDRTRLDKRIPKLHDDTGGALRLGGTISQEPSVILESLKRITSDQWPLFERVFGKNVGTQWKLARTGADEAAHLQGYIEMHRIRELMNEFEKNIPNATLSPENKKKLVTALLDTKDHLIFLEILAAYTESMDNTKRNPPPDLTEKNPKHKTGWRVNAALETYFRLGPTFKAQATYWQGRRDAFGKSIAEHLTSVESEIPLESKTDEEQAETKAVIDKRMLLATNRALFIEKEIKALKASNRDRTRKYLESLKTEENKKIIGNIELEIEKEKTSP